MLLFNLQEYFVGEINVPRLPTERSNDNFAYYGSAKMMQTAGENDLLTFIDTKATEYLVKMFGSQMADALLREWYDYTTETDVVKTSICSIANDMPRNQWIEQVLPEEIDVDLLFSDFVLEPEGYKKTTDRFGSVKTFTFTGGDLKVRLRIDATKTDTVLLNVNSSEIENALTLYDSRSVATISKPFRTLLNHVFTNSGQTKVSAAANYIYYWLMRDASNGTTAMGEADLNFSRATSAYETDKFLKVNAIRNKLIRSWNVMVDLNRVILTYLYANKADYPFTIPTTFHKEMTRTQNTFNL